MARRKSKQKQLGCFLLRDNARSILNVCGIMASNSLGGMAALSRLARLSAM